MKLWRPSRAGVTEFVRTAEPDPLRHICKPVALGACASGTIAWHNRKDKQWLPVVYCVFLILYITLLRRAPGYNESIRLRLKLWPNAGVWAGNLLNLIRYVPYGVTSWQWKREGKKIVVAGFALSVFCEVLQYLTGRGMADVNDVLFNTLGAAVGVWLARRIA